MKTMTKRLMSLLLCGAMLVSNVPVGALAAECSHVCGEDCYQSETVCAHVHGACGYVPAAEGTEEVPCGHGCSADTGCVTTSQNCQHVHDDSCGYQEQVEQPEQQAPELGAGVAASEPVMNEAMVTNYSIFVNGEAVTDVNCNDVLGDGSVVYAPDTNTVTLNGAGIISIVSGNGANLTIALAENTQNTVSGVIQTNKNLTISGKGVLSVGQIEAAGDLSIADAVVKAGEEKKEEEAPVTVITVNKEITFSGAAHLAVADGQNSITVSDAESNGECKVNGTGYYRTDKTAGFAKTESESSGLPTGNVTYYEFVGADHVDTAYTGDASNHYRSCLKLSDELACPLAETIISEAHSGETKYVDAGTAHSEVYACCGTVKESGMSHKLQYSESGATISVVCTDCGADGSITLKATDGVWNGTPAEVHCESAGLLKDEKPEITYAASGKERAASDPTTTLPTAVGSYVASISLEDNNGASYRAYAYLSVTKVDISEAIITLGQDSYDYDGLEKKPKVESVVVNDTALTLDTDYSVSYENNINAGTAVVKITAKGEHYTGTAKKDFTIGKAETVASLFTCVLPDNSGYDGSARKANVTANSTIGMGNITVKYYDNNGNQVKDTSGNPVTEVKDAGTYTVKIDVDEGTNYSAANDLSNNWKFTINQTSNYTNETQATQTIQVGGDVRMPVFYGVTIGGEREIVEGDLSYKLNDAGITLAALTEKLKTLQGGDTATIAYTFSPKTDGNYKSNEKQNSGTITVTVVDISFKVGDEKAAAQNAAIEKPNAVYGDQDAVNLKTIKVTINNQEDTDPEFLVRYKNQDGDYQKTPIAGNEVEYTVFYNASQNFAGAEWKNVEVFSGKVKVAQKTPTVTPPAGNQLIYNEQDQTLVTAGTTDGGTLQYSLYQNRSYSSDLPTAKAAGAYYVWYKVVGDNNYKSTEAQKITVVIDPKLTATYGQTLADIKLKLPAGFSLNTEKNPEADSVGNAGINKIYLDYMPTDTANYPTVTAHPVSLTVNAISVELDVTIADAYLPYDGDPVKPELTVKIKGTNDDLDEKEYELVYSTDITNPGQKTVTVHSKGNYAFNDITKEYVVHRVVGLSFSDTSVISNDLKAAGFTAGKDVIEKINEKLDENYPTDKQKFYNFVVKQAESTYVYDEFYWPDDGVGFNLSYITGTSKDDDFKVYAMYSVDSASRLGTKAGTIVELTETTSTPGINQYKKTDSNIRINLKNYAVVCVAAKEDQNATYKVSTASSSYGTVKFTVGTSTTLKTSDDAVKVGETLTITVTPNTNYAVSKLQYTYKDGTTTKAVTITQDDEGNYTLKMPAKDITLKATFAKKTTSGNPNSGDSSNIYFWSTAMGLSALGAVALLYGRKRRFLK